MIAEAPDLARPLLACGWCERPLAPAATAALRCAGCGSRTGRRSPHEDGLPALTMPVPALAPLAAGPTAERGGDPLPCRVARLLRHRARRRLARRLAVMAPPGAVLDVGSGDEVLLQALRASGRVATAIGRPDGRSGEVDVTELGGRYAAIVFWESLGRIPAPRAALEHAAALLKPDGVLAVVQPTSVALPALTERLARGGPAPAARLRIPQRELVERLRTLGLEIVHADRVRDRSGVAGWTATVLGGVVSVEARR